MTDFIPDTNLLPTSFSSSLNTDSLQNQQSGSSLVFIDPSVDNYTQLVNGLVENTEVIVLDDSRDGIFQITEILSHYQNISSVHIVSHGESSQLTLGATELTSTTLDSYRNELTGWSNSLSETADILLYGCHVASSPDGLAFVKQIGQLTKADIAASTDLTGHSALGGNWTLEYSTGSIESDLAFQTETLQNYSSAFGSVSTDDLVMHLTFDETAGTLAADTSPFGNSNTGNLLNGASFVDTDTPLEGAVQLDGVDDYVTVDNSSDINVGTFNKRSISIWFKVNDVDYGGEQVIFEEGASKKGLSIYVKSSNLYVGGWNTKSGWSGTFLSTDAIQSDTWHHVGLVLDTDTSNTIQSGAFRAYIDGVNFGQGDGVQLSSHGNPTGIGGINQEARFHTGVGSTGGEIPNYYALNGTIADVQLYNRALSNNEMATLASEIDTSPSLPTDALVMELAFDDASGTVAADTSPFGNDNSGTLLNGASFIDTGNPLEGVVRLDGVDDYVAVSSSSDINNGTFTKRTISAWFKVDDKNISGQKQVIFEEGGGKKGLNIYVDDGQLYVGGWNTKNGWSGTFLSTDAISSNSWHHVALVLDANNSNNPQPGVFKAYLDGVQFGVGEGVKLTSHGNPMGIGAINSSARFHTGNINGSGTQALAGNIGDVRLYNQALDTGEIALLASVLNGLGDAIAPTATLYAPNLATPGDTVYTFTVNYTDNVAVDVFSLDNNDIRVVGPSGFSQAATLVSVVNGTTNGDLRSATYQIIAPGGDWDATDNGIYEVLLEAGQVSDTSGNFALGGSLGTFAVDIAQSNPNPQSIVFPSNAGVIDVTAYGAIPNDGIDDTAAIQQALNENFGENYVFYLRDGVYDISDTLTLGGSEKRSIFQGQSQSGTILRLMDSVDQEFQGALIRTGGANGNNSADRFRNAVRNLTLNVGVGHANAVGLQFWSNNQGVVEDVTILSEDGQGQIGLDMSFDDGIGPLFVHGLTVDGFDYGIKTRWQTASQTFEDITLKNQNIYGWWNITSQRVFARNVTSINSVTAIRNEFEAGMVLIDSVLTGTGANVPAIYNQKSLYVRNIETSGYSLGIENALNYGRGNPDVGIGYIDEYFANGSGNNRSGGPFELFDSPDRMLNLPIQDIPDVPWETDFNNWANPGSFMIGTSGIANDGLDDTAAIQAAIDSGATTIYLPQGTWNLDGTLELRGNVVRFLGTGAILDASDTGVIRVTDGTASTVIIERLEGLGKIEHASDRTLVLNNLFGFEYAPTISTPGNVFINDSTGRSVTFRNQNAWARQLNLESDTQSDPNIEAKVLNDNSQVWILGLKTEDEGTVVKTINGGATELLGTLHVGGGISNVDNPRFVTIDSSFSVAGIYGGGFSVLASETRNGEVRTTNTFNLADVYTAYAPASAPIAQWAFNGNAADSSSNGYNGTIIGGASFVNRAPDGTQALSLNGTNQFVQTSNFLSPSQQLALTTWVKNGSSTWDTSTALIDKGNAFRLETVAGTQLLRFSIRESQTNGPWQTVEFDLSNLSNFNLTDWHHYAASYDSNTGQIQLYVDGILQATTDLSSSSTPVQISPDAGPMIIGHNINLNTYFGGLIDDVRLYDRALTSSEILALIR